MNSNWRIQTVTEVNSGMVESHKFMGVESELEALAGCCNPFCIVVRDRLLIDPKILQLINMYKSMGHCKVIWLD